MLEPGLEEGAETLRRRILDVWKTWPWAGIEKGRLDQLRACFRARRGPSSPTGSGSSRPKAAPLLPIGILPTASLVIVYYRPPRDKYAIDGADWWSRTWVIGQTDKWQGDGVWDDGGTRDYPGTWDQGTVLRWHVG